MKMTFSRQPHDTREQFHTIGTTPLRILIRKVNAKITFTQGAKDSVSNRMSQGVGV
jgi:hypothetical protein